MTTERLYYTDAYLGTFAGRVVAVDGARVTLDRTAFYPTSGGQQFDTGSLDGARVVDVTDEADAVVHILDGPRALAVGAEVSGVVDWARRFDHMQQHTGQHLLSALFEDMAGAATASVHFGAESCTLDIEADALARTTAAKVEERANVIVAENRAVTVSFEDAASVTGLRKASERSGTLRVISIEGIDRSACGGTHVRATGEIGAVLIRKLEKYKKLTRVEFLCGARAVRQARADYDALSSLAAALTTGIDDLPRLVLSQAESMRALESEMKKAREALAGFRARERYDSTAPGADGVRRVEGTFASADELRAMAHAFSALPKAAFIGTCEAPPTVVFAASADSGIDAGARLKAALASNGGRGGGNAKIAQGTVPGSDALAAIVRSLAD